MQNPTGFRAQPAWVLCQNHTIHVQHSSLIPLIQAPKDLHHDLQRQLFGLNQLYHMHDNDNNALN